MLLYTFDQYFRLKEPKSEKTHLVASAFVDRVHDEHHVVLKIFDMDNKREYLRIYKDHLFVYDDILGSFVCDSEAFLSLEELQNTVLFTEMRIRQIEEEAATRKFELHKEMTKKLDDFFENFDIRRIK